MIRLTRLWLLVAALSLLAGPAAAADKVAELSKILLQDTSYKVRLQAALLLGKVGDASAAPALIKALGDEHRTVRGMAVQSLAKLNATEAAEPLRALLKREPEAFVRGQIQKALASLGSARPGGKTKIYLTFGAFSGGAKLADRSLLDVLHAALKKELGKSSSITFTLDGGEEKNFARSGRVGFLIDGNVSRLDDGVVAGSTEINCDVKVMVARWPSKSIILWTNAGAAVQGGSRERDKEIARRDCLEASATQVGEDLAKFFQSQGG
jgi:hypothetical protein